MDQFSDETIGEWSLFNDEATGRQGSVTHGVFVESSSPPSEDVAKEKEEPKTTT